MYDKNACGSQLSNAESKKYLIDMLDKLTEWCDSHGITCYLSGGTLLGAIRHKGFIPWDDDIDVNIARPDIERIYRETGGKIGKYILTKGGEDTYSVSCQTYRLYNPDIVIENFRQSKKEKPFYHPLFIDICPIDGFPEGERETKNFCRKLIFLRKMLGVSWHPLIMKKNFVYALLNILLYIPAKAVGCNRWAAWFQKTAQRYSYDDSKYIGVTTIVHYLPREKVLKKDYINSIEVDFEGKKYKAPGNYDIYLKNLYGDYMMMPPEEKRKSDHIFNVYMKKTTEGSISG